MRLRSTFNQFSAGVVAPLRPTFRRAVVMRQALRPLVFMAKKSLSAKAFAAQDRHCHVTLRLILTALIKSFSDVLSPIRA